MLFIVSYEVEKKWEWLETGSIFRLEVIMRNSQVFHENYRTFGVLINQIEGRYQSLLLEGFRRFAEENNTNIIFFTGRALKSPYPQENEYNIIYKLAESRRLDGIIIAAGTIGNYMSNKEIQEFCSNYSPLPVVSISRKIPGIPSVFSDNKSAMETLINHLIEAHGFKRIAFLKGNNTNPEAEERYQGYLEALSAQNISIIPDLIYQGDFSYQAGENFIHNLLKMKQIPFEALACANDEMALAICQKFSSIGIMIPRDIVVTGFDDISEVQQMIPPLTTIHQPIFEEARKACTLLNQIINGEKVPEETIIPSKLIIRESCGCYHLPFQSLRLKIQFSELNEQIEKKSTSKEQINLVENQISEIRENIQMEIIKATSPDPIDKKEILSISGILIDTLLLDLKTQKSPASFIYLLNEFISRQNLWTEGIQSWQLILSVIRAHFLALITDPRLRYFIEDVFQNAQAIAAQQTIHREIIRSQELMNNFLNLRNIIRDIHIEFELDMLIEKLRQCLPVFRIPGFYIVLYPEAGSLSDLPEELILALGLSETNFNNNIPANLCFSTSQILPDVVVKSSHLYRIAILPLFCRSIHFGFIAIEFSQIEEIIMDFISEQISLALYTIKLFQDRKKANEKREAAIAELRSSESRFRNMALFLPTIIIETDINNKILFMNQSGKDLLFSEKDTKTDFATDLIFQEDRDRILKLLDQIRDSKTLTRTEFRMINKNKSPVTMLVHLIPIQDEKGILTGLRWNVIDAKPLMISAIYPDESFYDKYRITNRAKEVMLLILQGCKIKEIASRLFITESTVKGHMGYIYNHLGVKNKAEMIHFLENYQLEHLGYQSFVFSLLNDFSGRSE